MNLSDYIEADVNVVIKDDRFDIHNLFDYQLTIEVSEHGFGLCVIDQATSRCLRLEKFDFDDDDIFSHLDQIYDEHQFLLAGYWKSITVAFVGSKFTLMPSALYENELSQSYLELNSPVTEQEKVISYRHQGSEIVNVFAFPKNIADYFQNKYPEKKIVFTHVTSALIEAANRLNIPQEDNLLVHVSRKEIIVLLKRKDTVEYCNVFTIKTEEDALYYLVFVISELRLNQESMHLYLWSDSKINTSLKEKAAKYVRNIHLGERPKELKFGYFFDELETYRLNSLYNIHLCE